LIAAATVYDRGFTEGGCSVQHMLSADITEVTIFEQAVIVIVHICKDLEDYIPVEAKLKLVNHAGEIGERYCATCSNIESTKSCRDFSKFFDKTLRE